MAFFLQEKQLVLCLSSVFRPLMSFQIFFIQLTYTMYQVMKQIDVNESPCSMSFCNRTLYFITQDNSLYENFGLANEDFSENILTYSLFFNVLLISSKSEISLPDSLMHLLSIYITS